MLTVLSEKFVYNLNIDDHNTYKKKLLDIKSTFWVEFMHTIILKVTLN